MATVQAPVTLDLQPTHEEQMLREAVRGIASGVRAGLHPRPGPRGRAADRALGRAGKPRLPRASTCRRSWAAAGSGCSGLFAVGEELAANGTPLLLIVVSPAIVGSIIAKHGTEEQKERFVRPIAAGTTKVAFAITEPDAGHELAQHLDDAHAREREVPAQRPEGLHLRRRGRRLRGGRRARQARRRPARAAVVLHRRRRRARASRARRSRWSTRAPTSSGRSSSTRSSSRRTA